MPRTHCHCALHIPRWISPEATIEKYSFLGKCVCGIFATPSWFPFHRQTSAFDQSFPFSLHDRVQWSTPCWIWWAKTWNLLPELFKLTHAHPMTLAKFVTRAFRTRWICGTKCTKRNILRPSCTTRKHLLKPYESSLFHSIEEVVYRFACREQGTLQISPMPLSSALPSKWWNGNDCPGDRFPFDQHLANIITAFGKNAFLLLSGCQSFCQVVN